jgi:hypothetical protein
MPGIQRFACCFLASLSLLACGSDNEAIDLRVPVPPTDSQSVNILSPEVTIEPGSEKMYCYYLDNSQADMAVSRMNAYQGKFGHHIVLLTTRKPKPVGTFTDCTSAKDMADLDAFVLPDTPLPDGYAVFLPKGLQYVMQIHYVNTGQKPILVRDVAQLKQMPVDKVHTWVGTLTASHMLLEIAPNKHTTATIDCSIPADVQLLVVGGHMHESGVRFETHHGMDPSSLKSIYLVDPWKAEYRDSPPVTTAFKNPMTLAKNSLLRTTCEWSNKTSETLTFPAEMCSTFAYIAGRKEAVDCRVQ